MSLEEKDVRHIARLSALEISDEEVPGLKKDLAEIIEYMDRLSEVSTSGVAPTSHVHGVVNAFRDDMARDSLPLDDLSKNAPDFAADSYRVHKIIQG